MKVVFFLANRGYALRSSRSGLIKDFVSAGWRVVICTADDNDSRFLESLGATLEVVSFARGSAFGIHDYLCYRKILALINGYQPDLIHAFHAKPLILSCLASKKVKSRPKIVVTITGLGHAFIKGGLIAGLAGFGYKLSLPYADLIIFQNSDDQKLFTLRGWGRGRSSKLIVGSGVDTSRIKYSERFQSKSSLNVLMLGRVLGQKGVHEFIRVASIIKSSGQGARFLWAGEVDAVHPDSLDSSCFDRTAVEYLGHLSEVRDIISSSDIFLFPSYREGVPRAIMEASASGIPTVAFDVPGVREVVQDGITGYLVPFGDVEGMAKKTLHLLENAKIRLKMGRNARAMAESSLDVRVIHEQYIQAYESLGVDIRQYLIGSDCV